MKRSDPDYEKFKKEFWLWFDQLPVSQKKRFWYKLILQYGKNEGERIKWTMKNFKRSSTETMKIM